MILSFEEFVSFTPKKETYALFGWPLGHTMSPELHAELFAAAHHDADYIGVAVPPEHLEEAVQLARAKLHGFNITIPHKKSIISYLDSVVQSALDLHSVNTVVIRDGMLSGYNTDILGFAASLEKDDIKLADQKVLILGYGGAASVMAYHCIKEGAQVTITGRNYEKAQALYHELSTALPDGNINVCPMRNIPRDTRIVINGTPVGMFPNEDQSPLLFLPHKTQYIFDAIYNPPSTALLKLANPRHTKTRDGLFMLVMQAAFAETLWYNAQFSDAVCKTILRHTYGKMAVKRLHDCYAKENIVLCGFMGCGKTTVGKKLSRLTGLPFYDADAYLEQREGRTISQIFAEDGEAYFRDLESKYLNELCQKKGIVLALGGGAVLRKSNVECIKKTGILIFLDTPFNRIVQNLSHSTTRPLLDDNPDRLTEMKRLYESRQEIYHNSADRLVRSPRLSDVVDRTIKSI